mmetsp:Transcript_789/g.3044  ORF Transcript_789/g.3044 Transcript_789/m.3044 type:complete len:207 (+) Transcript_789:185-805(+)
MLRIWFVACGRCSRMGKRAVFIPNALALGSDHAVPRARKSTMPPMTYIVSASTVSSKSVASGERYTKLRVGTVVGGVSGWGSRACSFSVSVSVLCPVSRACSFSAWRASPLVALYASNTSRTSRSSMAHSVHRAALKCSIACAATAPRHPAKIRSSSTACSLRARRFTPMHSESCFATLRIARSLSCSYEVSTATFRGGFFDAILS